MNKMEIKTTEEIWNNHTDDNWFGEGEKFNYRNKNKKWVAVDDVIERNKNRIIKLLTSAKKYNRKEDKLQAIQWICLVNKANELKFFNKKLSEAQNDKTIFNK